jgi:spore germination protein YaaH
MIFETRIWRIRASRRRWGKRRLIVSVAALVLALGCASVPTSSPAARTASLTRSIAYVAYWDAEAGFATVDAHPEAINEVSPWWYSLESDGTVRLQDSSMAKVERERVDALQARGVRVVPAIANHKDGAWDDDVVPELLERPAVIESHVTDIVDFVIAESYDGINIDYENLRADSREGFSSFMEQLSRALHDQGRLLTVDLHAKTSDAGAGERNIAHDYARIGPVVDQARIMAYDYHWQDSAPGPVAPIDWVEQVVQYTIDHIPREKVVVGIPLFGYDWPEEGRAEVVTWQEAQSRAQAHSATIQRDERFAAPWFTYTDESGQGHTVWFEDDQSVAAKLRVISRRGVPGVFFWRVGGESPGVWSVVNSFMRH